MKKIFTVAIFLFGACFSATTVNAGTVDFADFAESNEGGIDNRGSIIFSSGDTLRFYTGDGLNLNTPGQPNFFPYFDDAADNGNPGGLGVCRALDGNAGSNSPGAECLDSSDDSIDGEGGLTESIWIEFVDGPFNIRSLSFRDGDHNDISHSDGLVEWGVASPTGTFGGINTFAELVAMAIAGDLDGVKFFGLAFVDTDFYLSAISDVPIPGAIPLLLSGLAGLGFFSRKQKNKSSPLTA